MSKDNLSDILNKLKAYKPILQQRYPISYLGVFGSYVRDEQNSNSDVDILIDVSQSISLFRLLQIEEDIAKYLGKKVDLVMRAALRKRIGQRILSEVVDI